MKRNATISLKSVQCDSTGAPAKASGKGWPSKAPLTVSLDELLVDGTDRSFRMLVERLLTFSATHVAIRDSYASMLNLSGPRYTILLFIRNMSDSGPVNIKIVAEHLRVSDSYVSVETKALVKMGLAYKDLRKDDRRMISLGLTQKGIDLLDGIAGIREKINSIEFGCLNTMEFRILVPLVDRLVQSSERALALQTYIREHGSMDDLDDGELPGR